jgi:hypothetical protein
MSKDENEHYLLKQQIVIPEIHTLRVTASWNKNIYNYIETRRGMLLPCQYHNVQDSTKVKLQSQTALKLATICVYTVHNCHEHLHAHLNNAYSHINSLTNLERQLAMVTNNVT